MVCGLLFPQEYLSSRAKLFNPEKTNPQVIRVRGKPHIPLYYLIVVQGNPVHSSDTVYFSGLCDHGYVQTSLT